MRKIAIILISMLIVLIGCGTKNSDRRSSTPPGLPGTLKMGASTPSDVEEEMGVPEKTYNVEDATMYNYKDDKTVKFEDNVIKGFYRAPVDDEMHLQYWLQKWKDKKTATSDMPGNANAHVQSDSQMTNQEERTTIIYNKENGMVKRVMYYEK